MKYFSHIFLLLAFSFSISFFAQQKVKLNSVIEKKLDVCNFEFKDFVNIDTPYELTFVETTIEGTDVDIYVKNNFHGGVIPTCSTSYNLPKKLSNYRKMIKDFDSCTIIFCLNDSYYPLKKSLNWSTYIPLKLTKCQYKNVQYIIFQLDNYSSTSSIYSPLSYTTIVLKLNKQQHPIANFSYTSARIDKPIKVLQRYMNNDKSF